MVAARPPSTHVETRHPRPARRARSPSAWGADARADKRTVCTITVNSPDEKETFRRYLPDDQYQFVELVERGRPDWLASACRQGVRCDMLVISGHFDGSTEFYSDRLDVPRVAAGRGDGARRPAAIPAPACSRS